MYGYWDNILCVLRDFRERGRDRQTEPMLIHCFVLSTLEQRRVGNWRIERLQEKDKEAFQLLKAIINLDLFHLLRAPYSEEEMTFSGFDPCSAIGSIPLFISIVPWEVSSCSCHNSVFTEGLAFRPRGCGK